MLAIVPFKAPPRAKARLAALLGPAERAALAEALCRHVVGAVRGAGLRPVVLTCGPVGQVGAEVWEEERPGLNAALAAALQRAGLPAAIIPADLPWLAPCDVRALASEPGDVVVAAAADGGTGGLLLRRPLRPAFGPRSALAHAAAARRGGLRARVVWLPGFARDLDDEASLVSAAASPAIGAELAAVLRQARALRRGFAGAGALPPPAAPFRPPPP